MSNLQFATPLITGIYLMAGLNKIGNTEKLARDLQDRVGLNLPVYFYIITIFLVIILQIVAPIIINYSVYTGSYRELAHKSIWALIGFSLLATYLFHVKDNMKIQKVLEHMVFIGALILLADSVNDYSE